MVFGNTPKDLSLRQNLVKKKTELHSSPWGSLASPSHVCICKNEINVGNLAIVNYDFGSCLDHKI